ncbi:hypothetical protein ACFL38_02600 [Candidatus Omnitrophota bacterium]
MNNYVSKNQMHRVVTQLNREEIDFLDKLSKDALFSTGTKLSRTQILRALIKAIRQVGLNSKEVDSEEAMVERIKGLFLRNANRLLADSYFQEDSPIKTGMVNAFFCEHASHKTAKAMKAMAEKKTKE